MPRLTPPRRVKNACRTLPPSNSSIWITCRALSTPRAARGSRPLEPGRRSFPRPGPGHRLEQGAHFRRVDQASTTAANGRALRLRGTAAQRLGPGLDTEPAQEVALSDRAVLHRPGLADLTEIGRANV